MLTAAQRRFIGRLDRGDFARLMKADDGLTREQKLALWRRMWRADAALAAKHGDRMIAEENPLAARVTVARARAKTELLPSDSSDLDDWTTVGPDEDDDEEIEGRRYEFEIEDE